MRNEKSKMRKILILTINFYQIFLSVVLKNLLGVNKMCKQSLACSEYTKQMIKKRGIFGIFLGAKRIGGCI